MYMSEKIFINFSNHPSGRWDVKQKKASEQYGRIVDIPFPMVPAQASQEEVGILAWDYYNKIIVYHPCAVMCQGEFTLCFQVVELLKQAGIPVLAACSERRVTEKNGKKIVEFEFQQYREY